MRKKEKMTEELRTESGLPLLNPFEEIKKFVRLNQRLKMVNMPNDEIKPIQNENPSTLQPLTLRVVFLNQPFIIISLLNPFDGAFVLFISPWAARLVKFYC